MTSSRDRDPIMINFSTVISVCWACGLCIIIMSDRGESQRADFLCHVPCQVDDYCDTQGYPECISCEQGPCFPGQSPGSFESEEHCKLVCPGYFTSVKTGNSHVVTTQSGITDVPLGVAANTSFDQETLLIGAMITGVIVLGLVIIIVVITGVAQRSRTRKIQNPDTNDEEESLVEERLTGLHNTIIRVDSHDISPRNSLCQ